MGANTRFSVALHVLAFLAWKEEPVGSSLLARSVGTNPVVIRRLLRALADEGLVRSRRGPLGGTRIARKPSEIRLIDVYLAAGEPGLLPRHPHNRRCPFGRAIRPGLEQLMDQLEEGLRSELAETTLADAMRTMKKNSTSDWF